MVESGSPRSANRLRLRRPGPSRHCASPAVSHAAARNAAAVKDCCGRSPAETPRVGGEGGDSSATLAGGVGDGGSTAGGAQNGAEEARDGEVVGESSGGAQRVDVQEAGRTPRACASCGDLGDCSPPGSALGGWMGAWVGD